MATWGVHSFENDDANEWAQAYREMGLFVAKSTMEVALGDFKNTALQADVAARAVAAVEAVAYALGRGSHDAEEAFAGAPEADRAEAEALIPLAEDVLAAVTGGSGLSAAWSEAGADERRWKDAMEELRERVGGAAPAVAPEVAEAPAATRPSAGTTATSDVDAAIAKLSSDIQALREEMRAGLVEIARLIGARNG